MDPNIKHIKDELKLIEEQYIEFKQLQIYCGTFNVSGKTPDENLASWLNINGKHIDIYAIGFQELVDLTTANLLLKNESNEQMWMYWIENELLNENNFKPKTKYVFITKIRMFGLFLLIYADQKLVEKNHITEIFRSSVATGLWDMVGNKGSLGVSLKLYETRVCFVCSHFAADTDKLEKRNSDFRTARLNLNFQNENDDFYRTLDDHDIIFWFGDLNYRLDKLSLNETIKYIFTNRFDELIKYDQLTQEKSNCKVFETYNEGTINFRPTYKYIAKSDLYEKQQLIAQMNLNETAENEANSIGKIKLPSWTDRVLWKSSNSKCSLQQYSCVNTITISDHKPVYAIFEIQAKKTDKKKYTKLYEYYLKESDKKINENMPHIGLDKFEFNFEECMYYDTKVLKMIVKNEGGTRCNVDISFFDNDNSSIKNKKPHSQQWITILPHHIERLDPKSEYTVELRTSFNKRILNHFMKKKKIEDLLIVKCLNGNQFFATISCIYKPTIIGFSLKALSTLNENSSFETCNKTKLIEQIETDINIFEENLNLKFKEILRIISSDLQMENLEKLKEFVEATGKNSIKNKNFLQELNISKLKDITESPRKNSVKNKDLTRTEFSNKPIDSKIEIYKRAFSHLYPDIIDNDVYFSNELSSEYKFLLEYLIERCEKETVLSNSTNDRVDLTTEELKNLALLNLSNKNFDEFRNLNLDLELLAELLFDLLYALPYPLIPSRYIDYCSFVDNNFEKSANLFFYIPISHRQLFHYIIKFLQIYLKKLSLNESNFSNMISEAIFQIDKCYLDKASSNILCPNDPKSAAINCQILTTRRFIKLFIENPLLSN